MQLHEYYFDSFEREIIANKAPALIVFLAAWCGPSQLQQRVFEKVLDDHEPFKFVKTGRIDVDQNAQLADRYGITTIPSTLIFVDGERSDSLIGFQAEEYIREYLDYMEGREGREDREGREAESGKEDHTNHI